MSQNDTVIIDHREISRYILNGLLATVIHFSVLFINIQLLHFDSAGLANLVAAFFGIATSFVGSRYFVYRGHTKSLLHHASRFVTLYATIALLHGLVLYVWSDRYGYSYQIGFVIATLLQITLSYIGNKVLVFK